MGRVHAIGRQGAAGASLRRLLALWWRNARTRRALGRLPPELLADVGLSAEMARREARRPFWRV